VEKLLWPKSAQNWPDNDEVHKVVECLTAEMELCSYDEKFLGPLEIAIASQGVLALFPAIDFASLQVDRPVAFE
jgi:hypothetical protein